MKGQVYKLRALLSQLTSQLVYKFNDWINLIKDKLIQLTKAGKLWRCGKNAYRLDWEKAIGKVFYIHNKPCLLLKRFKEDDNWYLTYFDGQDIITETQNQAKYRKNISKKAIIEKPQDKIAIPNITYQLCLPPAREYIDLLVEEANRLGEKRNQRILNNPKCFDKKGKLKKHIRLTQSLDYISSTFREKFFFVHGLFLDFYEIEEINRIFKKLLASVHPDKTHQNTNEDFLLVMEWCNFN